MPQGNKPSQKDNYGCSHLCKSAHKVKTGLCVFVIGVVTNRENSAKLLVKRLGLVYQSASSAVGDLSHQLRFSVSLLLVAHTRLTIYCPDCSVRVNRGWFKGLKGDVYNAKVSTLGSPAKGQIRWRRWWLLSGHSRSPYII